MVEQVIAKTLQEALNLLDQKKYTIYAGGTDLIIQNRSVSEIPVGFTKPVLYCANIKELSHIRQGDDYVYIGAMTTLTELLNHEATPRLLKEAIQEMASPAIRNIATLSGNIGNASPAGDSLVPLYVLNALIKCQSASKSRLIPIHDFFIGLKKTQLRDNEMITEIIIPRNHFNHTMYRKVGTRKADALSKVSFAGAYSIVHDKICDFRIALGAVNVTVVRRFDIEAKLIGKSVEEAHRLSKNIIDAYLPSIQPINDQRSNIEYRTQVSINLIQAFLDSIKR